MAKEENRCILVLLEVSDMDSVADSVIEIWLQEVWVIKIII